LRELKTDATGRKLAAKFNKMQKRLAEELPRAVNNAIKEKGEEWQLNAEDQELLAESVENCFDVLDIQFNIAPIAMQLSNPLWVLLLPLLALILIFVPKSIKNLPKEKGDENVPTTESGSEVDAAK
jgi:hypothetical protein